MTEPNKSNYKALNCAQEQRAEAVHVARDVLMSSTGIFGGRTVPSERGVQDLLTLAEYIIGDPEKDIPLREVTGQGFPIPAEVLPDILQKLAEGTPDCGHPECPIHAPRREAQDADPQDAKSSFDDWKANTTGQAESVEPNWERHGSERLATPDGLPGMLEESDLSGGEADSDAMLDQPPNLDPTNLDVGHRGWVGPTGWEVAKVLGRNYWKRLD